MKFKKKKSPSRKSNWILVCVENPRSLNKNKCSFIKPNNQPEI